MTTTNTEITPIVGECDNEAFNYIDSSPNRPEHTSSHSISDPIVSDKTRPTTGRSGEIVFGTADAGTTKNITASSQSPASTVAAQLIARIHHNAAIYWHQPDHQGLDCVLAFLGAYYLHEPAPLWLHVVSPPGSGKTALALAPVMQAQYYKDYWQLGTITQHTLLSGLATGKQGGKMNSLLHRIGNYGLVYMPDFTTFLSKDQRVVESVAGDLREIWDGRHTKQTGASDGRNAVWEGRISWITAMTPDREQYWVRHNAKGERFAILRWRAVTDYSQLTGRILSQVERDASTTLTTADGTAIKEAPGPSQWITDWTRVLLEGAAWMADKLPQDEPREGSPYQLDELPNMAFTPKPLAPTQELIHGLSEMAEVVTLLRTVPPRPDGQHVGQMYQEQHRESPARFQHQLLKVLRGWAYINRREVIADDMSLVRRVAMDSIPIAKLPLVQAMLDAGGAMSCAEMRYAGGYKSWQSLQWQLEDLEALGVFEGVLDENKGSERYKGGAEWYLKDEFGELWMKAFGKV